MDPITQQQALAAAGAGGDPVYVDDVFSTYLYKGNGTSQTIVNGIDLSGEGGLVWIRNRNASSGADHIFTDTERGTNTILESNRGREAQSKTDMITSFNSNGFSIADNGHVNENNDDICSWTFRKCPGFFDIVTYTGNGTAGRTVAHDLGSVPGCIIIKCTNVAEGWVVFHRSLGATTALRLHQTNAKQDETFWFNDTAPTSSEFTLGVSGAVNDPGRSYVAYIFAHDDQSFGDDGDEAIIKCGSYTGNGQTSGPTINLGFEPQYVIIKRADSSDNWLLFDNMRGVSSGGDDAILQANQNGTEASYTFNAIKFTPTGFQLESVSGGVNGNGGDYIYIAIRRPHKPPEAGTEVFDPELLTSASQTSTPGFAPDMAWQIFNRTYPSFYIGNRLTGNGSYLQTYSSNAEGSFTSWEFDAPTGEFTQSLSSGSTTGGIQYFFKRAPGFFDVVTFTGNGSTQDITHNLGVAPELLFIKSRSSDVNFGWTTYSAPTGNNNVLRINNNTAASGTTGFRNTTPTATQFFLEHYNDSGVTFIAYLFASLDGVSKVGSYTGTGSNVDVDCGFTAGARFVLIKRTDSTGDWYVWDSARGIVGGNDPYVLLNSTAAEVTNTDYIDPLNSGFTVTSSAPAALNTSGGTYIFLAIA